MTKVFRTNNSGPRELCELFPRPVLSKTVGDDIENFNKFISGKKNFLRLTTFPTYDTKVCEKVCEDFFKPLKIFVKGHVAKNFRLPNFIKQTDRKCSADFTKLTKTSAVSIISIYLHKTNQVVATNIFNSCRHKFVRHKQFLQLPTSNLLA